jgi:2-dehydropantoate 2-reductase
VRIAVYGAGGVGGYFGGRLAEAGHEVHLIARGAHLDALRANGLRVRSGRGDIEVRVPATADPAGIGPCDIVLFCVKSYDTLDAAAHLAPMLGGSTGVVSLQNGVDNEAAIAGVIGWHHVIGGASFIFATVAEPGVIEHTGGPSSLSFGEWDGTRSERVRAFADACVAAGIPTEVPDDIQVVLWSKYAFICAQAGLTATTRLPIGEIRSDPAALALLRALVEEVVAVAQAEGVALPDTVVDGHLRSIMALPEGGRSSLYHDLMAGHRLELEALHGTLTRLADKHAIPAPAARAVYAILSPWAARYGS